MILPRDTGLTTRKSWIREKGKLVEEKMIDKNGAMKWIETIKTPFYDERGNIMGATGIAATSPPANLPKTS
jgi:hypothetical protein